MNRIIPHLHNWRINFFNAYNSFRRHFIDWIFIVGHVIILLYIIFYAIGAIWATPPPQTTRDGHDHTRNDRQRLISEAGRAYEQLTQQLIGPQERSPVQSYESLFPDPASIFPRRTPLKENAESLMRQLEAIRRTLTTRRALLHHIGQEMDNVIGGSRSSVALLLSQVAGVSDTFKYVFIGSRSAGKSHAVNAIASLSLSAMKSPIGTNSQVCVKLRTAPSGQEHFELDSVMMQFEDLRPELQQRFEQQQNVNEKEVELEIRAPFIAYPLNFVELPDYDVANPTETALVIEQIRKYAQDPHVRFVMISDASRDPDTEADRVLRTVQELVDAKRTLFIINNVNTFMREAHSPREFAARIKKIIDHLRCPDDNLPYLFAVPTLEGVEEDRAFEASPERQIELWESAVTGEEQQISHLRRVYIAHLNRLFANGYPADRLGVKAWKSSSIKSLIYRFEQLFAQPEELLAPMTAEMARVEVPQWTRVADDFNFELVTLLERVAKNSEGVWERIVELGGAEMTENMATRQQRTGRCVDHIVSPHEFRTNRFVESTIRGRALINPIGYKGTNGDIERGNSLLLAEIFELKQWMLRSYYELSDADIDVLIEKEHRHALLCDHAITPLVISSITKRIFSEASVRRQVARLQCTFRRVARSALWLLLEERDASDPIRILAMQPDFQKHVNERFDEYLNQVYERAARWISKAAANTMDAQITDRQLEVKRALLKDTFEDLYDDWPAVPSAQQCIPVIGHLEDLQNNELPQFYELIRREAKLHYSDRIMLLSQMITATHTMEWEDLSTTESLKQLRDKLKLNDNEQSLVNRFNLARGFLTAAELSAENQRLLSAMREELCQIRHKFNNALEVLKRIDPLLLITRRMQPNEAQMEAGANPVIETGEQAN